jgi:hypothetical protein
VIIKFETKKPISIQRLELTVGQMTTGAFNISKQSIGHELIELAECSEEMRRISSVIQAKMC